MFLKIFTLEFNSGEGAFQDSLIMDFLKDKNLISVKDYLVEQNGKTFLTVIVTYSLKEVESVVSTRSHQLGPAKADAWKELISKDDEFIFNGLRNWRLEESKQQGFPPFIIFTNKQLAEIATLKPKTLNQLSQIDGIGPSKMDRYGEKILRLIVSFLARPPE